MRLPSTANPWDRLWPSLWTLRTELLSSPHSSALPESVRNALLAMGESESEDASHVHHNNLNQLASSDQQRGDKLNRHRIGVLTRRINTFLEHQMSSSQKTSEAVYTPATLDAYDALVWDFNAPFHWRIRRQEIEALYQEGLRGSQSHCEVAVGTGLFLRQWARRQHGNIVNDDKENLDVGDLQKLTLLDLSPSSLEGCYQRLLEEAYFASSSASNDPGLQQLFIEKVQANITTDPPKHLHGRFDSVAANFLLHCLHGSSMQDKVEAIRSCANLLQPEGVFFGSTILGKDLEEDAAMAGPYAIQTNQLYNELGIFGNHGDTFKDLETILGQHFHEVAIVKVGYCAVWLAKKPKNMERRV